MIKTKLVVNKRKRIQIMPILVTAIQTLCVVSAIVLNNLSHKSAGINHHMMFRKHQYMQTILDMGHMAAYRMLTAGILALAVLILIRHPNRKYFGALSPLMLFSLLIGFALSLPVFMEMPAYAYVLFLMGLIWFLELIKVIAKVLQLKLI